MDIKTFRAKTMREALAQVRRQLGPDAAVLHTRELNSGPIARLLKGRCIEVAARPASEQDRAPASDAAPIYPLFASEQAAGAPSAPAPAPIDRVADRLEELHTLIESLSPLASDAQPIVPKQDDALSEPLFNAFTNLLEADVERGVAHELVEAARRELPETLHAEPVLIEEHLVGAVRERLATRGPIAVEPGATRVVALVGPTGVGKTTTIAKLAANFRIRDRRSVGLITVDTYRVAAVEQLRTYADIIDLPMEVVATPREMRAAVDRLRDCEVVLIDTAGRSPRDEIRLQELRAMLGEASPDEVHLVLSATTTRRALTETIRRFDGVGVDSLLLTKLDEAATLGGLIGVAERDEQGTLPISYLTDGQDVPDDIRVAERDELARLLLKPETV